jgi:hypothetical protein
LRGGFFATEGVFLFLAAGFFFFAMANLLTLVEFVRMGEEPADVDRMECSHCGTDLMNIKSGCAFNYTLA